MSADFWFFVDAQSVVLRVSGVVLRVSVYWGVGGCDWSILVRIWVLGAYWNAI